MLLQARSSFLTGGEGKKNIKETNDSFYGAGKKLLPKRYYKVHACIYWRRRWDFLECERMTNNRGKCVHVLLSCKWGVLGEITVVPHPVWMAWHTAYSVLYTVCRASRTHSCLNRFLKRAGWKSNSENLLRCAGYQLPLWEKCTLAASWFIGLAQEGRHYGCDAGPFLRSRQFLMRYPPHPPTPSRRPRRIHRCSAQA